MEEIPSVTPWHIEQALQAGLALFDETRFEEALAVFDEALTRFGPDMGLYHWKGVTLRHLGRLREAIEALELSSVESPTGSLYELAVLLLEEDVDSERGTTILTRLSADGDLPAREYLAHRAYEQGQFARVIELARAPRSDEADAQWPDSMECLETLEGIALTETGRLEEARFHLKRASRRHPACASHLTNLGRIYQLEKRYTRALQYYMQAMELDPDDPVPQINLAHLHEEMGRTESAEMAFSSLLRGFEGDPAVLEDYARFLARNHRLDEAVQLVERALQEHVDDTDINTDLAAFLGWLALDAGDQERARAIWESQIAHQAGAFAARHYLAGLFAEQGQTERAMELLEAAHRIDAACARNWCVRPDGEVEPCFSSLAGDPRFLAITQQVQATP